MSMESILTYEEIVAIAKAAVGLGIRDFRVTGGEPLVRRDCAVCIRMLRDIAGVNTIGLTTNGILLKEQLPSLLAAGLDSVNISLDALDRGVYADMTGKDALDRTLEGIAAAAESGLPVKLNVVSHDRLNWREMLEFGKKQRVLVRFIELMPIGYGGCVPHRSNQELLAEMTELYGQPQRERTAYGKGPAEYYYFPQAEFRVGFISALEHKFCDACNKIRLTSDGWLKQCLCYESGVNLREILRQEERREQLSGVMRRAIYEKPREHCFGEESLRKGTLEKRGMSSIGG